MRTVDRQTSQLLVIDFQARLMPAIHDAEAALLNADRLIEAAAIFAIPVLFTEQNARGLGPTVAELTTRPVDVAHKLSFDACRAEGFTERLARDRPDIVVAGCEAHVCVLQTVLGLLDAGRKVFVVADAIGARRPESKAAALARMERHGAEIVTAEMVLFEWLGSADFPRFKEVVALIR